MTTHRTLAHLAAGIVLSATAMLMLLLLLMRPGMALFGSTTGVVALPSTSAAPVTAAAVDQNEADAIGMTLTVGTDQDHCATTKAVTVTAGFYVVYCLMVENRSNVTWTNFMVSDESSQVHFSVPFTLTPPQGLTPTFYITAAAPALGSALKELSLYATNESEAATVATDTVQLIVPTIQVTHTVGTDASTCATTTSIEVPAGTAVTHCYQVHNVGDVTLLVHDVEDSQIGLVAHDWPFVLEPDATVQITATAIVSVSTNSVVTWTAALSDGLYAIATASATVHVPALAATTTVGAVGDTCADSEIVSATVGDDVFYCYYATNLGDIVLQNLVAIDSVSAQQLVVTYTLTGGATFLLRVSYPLTQSVVNTVTWQAQTASGIVVTATATAYANPLARLNVFAFYDVDRDGRQAWSEYPVPAVTFTLASATLAAQVNQTDEAGSSTFPALPTDQYTLTVATTNMATEYFVPEANKVMSLTIDAPGVYSVTVPLTRSDATDSDGDGVPDHIDGTGDDDEDGDANYRDPDLYQRLPLVMR